jgi:riboflavin synthase
MFTGIIENIGKVLSLSQTASGARLVLQIGPLARQVKPGGSVAVNGVCLSVVKNDEAVVEFDVVFETLSRSNLGQFSSGEFVNIELPLKVSDRIEGHFVQGHVDTTCRIVGWQDQGAAKLLTLELEDPEYQRYIIPKGSVALDGISLTVVRVSGQQFSIALIPTTLEKTTLLKKSTGAKINLETDILVKTIMNLLQPAKGSDEKLMDTLKQSGFIV